MDWRHRAICRDEDPELFFPTGEEHTTGKHSTGPVAAQNTEAKTVCRRCPVVTDCLAWAVEEGLPFGVAGGMTADERRELSKGRPRKKRESVTAGTRGRPRRRTR
jgi:WhiB family transcriptional regulator, redox-sensing transcriptional regulator